MVYIVNLNNSFIDSLLYLNEYYGVTQNPDTKDFIIIMKYYKSDLRNYITKNKDFYNIQWEKKLKILKHIAKGLSHIHNQNIIHHDLHSENILCENENDVVISDLGISKSAMESANDNKIIGIISYIAPEILQRKECTKASDIYSFSIVMWELLTGRMPFTPFDFDNTTEFMIGILDGHRPKHKDYIAPEGYFKLMQECWNPDPIKRPNAYDIMQKLDDMLKLEVNNNPTEIIKLSDITDIIPTSKPKGKQLSSAIISTRSSELGK